MRCSYCMRCIERVRLLKCQTKFTLTERQMTREANQKKNEICCHRNSIENRIDKVYAMRKDGIRLQSAGKNAAVNAVTDW